VAGVRVLNVMASPGAGKTSLILATLARLADGVRPAVIEGDVAGSIDADRIAREGVPVVQINTGGNCHLDAPMVARRCGTWTWTPSTSSSSRTWAT
jgi:hydrogenase nickel incorporation protein HypB